MFLVKSNTQPTLLTCGIGLETANREIINNTAVGIFADAQPVYTKFQPAKLSFTLESSFGINVSSRLDPKKNRIIEWNFGVVENTVKMIKKNIRGKVR